MKFTAPEFENKELWELIPGETRGLFYEKKGAAQGELHSAVLVGGAAKKDGMLAGMIEHYKHRKAPARGKTMKLFGVRVVKWWHLENDEASTARVVCSGIGCVYCKPGIVKVEFEFDTKGVGDTMWVSSVRVRVSESDHTMFKVVLERDSPKEEGKVRLG